MDKTKPTEFEKNKLEFMAVQETIAAHVVGILTHEGQNVGTGTLIGYRQRRLVLTADHVLETTPISKVRFAFRLNGNLQYAPLRSFGTAPTPLLGGEAVDPLRVVRDKKNDLVAVVLRPQQELPGGARTYDAHNFRAFEITQDASLFFTGFPMANAIAATPRTEAVGMVAEHSYYDIALNQSKEVTDRLNSKTQFAVKYTWANELPPDGFSGSAIWCGLNSSSAIWTPNLALVGVVTDYVQSLGIICATNLMKIRTFLRRVSR